MKLQLSQRLRWPGLLTAAALLLFTPALNASAPQAPSDAPTPVGKGDSSSQPDAESLFKEGRAYARGERGVCDPVKAMECLRKAAEMGYPAAQYAVAYLYDHGQGVARDPKEAVVWLKKAAENGSGQAQYSLALHYLKGEGIASDQKQALGWITKAAENGIPEAQIHLARLYYFGDLGVSKDEAVAFQWASKAAGKGVVSAQNMLGAMYENGQGCKRDTKEAMRYFGLGAEQGNAKAQSNLGRLLATTDPQSKLPAYKWLKLSADQGEVTAVNFLREFQCGMKPGEIAEGNRLVQEFQARPNHTNSQK